MNGNIIDMHVHYGSPPDDNTGCYWSKEFEKTPAYLLMRAMTKTMFRQVTPERIQKVIFDAINTSEHIDKTVLLAMDEVYDKSGAKQQDRTHLYVPNEYVAALAAENPRFLFGASVHPFRRDWEKELDDCLHRGAVLCKWIPSAQQIDPSDGLCVRFYEKLARHNLPLLCHAGPEYTIPTSNEDFNKFNNPRYLEMALDLGVTVIIAHCALPYFNVFEEEYMDDFKDFLAMMAEADARGWLLYADLSADATTFRRFKMDDVVNKVPHSRLLLGSDFPIPASILSYSKITDLWEWLKYILQQVIKVKNPLDKNYNLIKAMGFDPIIFSNADQLFARIKR